MINRKILTSLMILGVVGALAAGSTWALFNDTETSDTNTFQAGPVEVDMEMPPGQPLAQMDDVKPGDVAEEEVSVEVEGNPAFVEMRLNQTLENTENSCTEPERKAEGGDCGTEGELRENTHLDVWYDENENGELDDGEEMILSNPHDDPQQLHDGMMLDADPSTEEIEPVRDDMTVMYRWEVPRGLGNEAQTDSFGYNLQVRAEQARHNGPENAADWYQVTGENAGELENDSQTLNESENDSEETPEQENESTDNESDDSTAFSGSEGDGSIDDPNIEVGSDETEESEPSDDQNAQSNNPPESEQQESNDTTEGIANSEDDSPTGQFAAGTAGLAGLMLALFVAASALYTRRL